MFRFYIILVSFLILNQTLWAVSKDTIKIASFNLQIFGEKKVSNTDVMGMILRIIKKYDITAVQEIRSKTDTAINGLMKMLGKDYEYVISDRLGRTNSKEQYAYIYNKKTITVTNRDLAYTYDDKKDIFQRAPFVAQFKTKNGNFDFVLINIHTEPDNTPEEIKHLSDVIADAKKHYTKDDDFIVLGDMNADCTYDRIIGTKEIMLLYNNKSGVFNFAKEYKLSPAFVKRISDHYPVFAEFKINGDVDIRNND